MPKKKMVVTKEERKYIGLSGSIGYIASGDYIHDLIYMIELNYFAPFHKQPLILSLSTGFYNTSEDKSLYSDVLRDLHLNFKLSVVPVLFNILYTVPLDFPLRPYLGGGAGVFVSSLNYNYDNPPHGSGRINDTGFGFSIRGGMSYGIQNGEIIGEYQFLLAKMKSIESVSGNIGGSSFLIGYRFVF